MYLKMVNSVAALGVTALIITGCSTQPTESPTPTKTASQSAAPETPEWSYEGATGPAHWGAENPSCETTAKSEQSPINIDNAVLKPSTASKPVELALQSAEFGVFNNGHTVEAAPESAGAAGSFKIGEDTYTVAQFHFHDPSEHTVDGKHSAMEMHIVGKTTSGKIAVLGVLLEVGAKNATLEELFNSMPTKVTEEEGAQKLSEEIDLSKIVPTSSEIARYEGSLTTPPCTEGVLWDVYLTPVTVSQDQVSAFSKLYSDNARPTQQLNGREINELDVPKA